MEATKKPKLTISFTVGLNEPSDYLNSVEQFDEVTLNFYEKTNAYLNLLLEEIKDEKVRDSIQNDLSPIKQIALLKYIKETNDDTPVYNNRFEFYGVTKDIEAQQ